MYCINRSRASDSYTLQLCFPDTFLLQKRFYQFCHIPYDVLIRSLYIRRHRCFCNYMLLFVNNPCFYIGSTKINSRSVHFFPHSVCYDSNHTYSVNILVSKRMSFCGQFGYFLQKYDTLFVDCDTTAVGDNLNAQNI